MHTEQLRLPQQVAVTDLLKKILQFSSQANDTPSLCQPLVTSSFAILGERGAGKSTLLHHVNHMVNEDRVQSRTDQQDWEKFCTNVAVLEPLDCSTLPPDGEPGMAVLCHIKKAMHSRKPPFQHLCDKDRSELEKSLHVLIGLYTRSEPEYRDLSLELSSSPDDYGHYRTEGLYARMSLREKLFEWLKNLQPFLDKDKKKQILLILLDDFDLISAAETRRWMHSLQDALSQPYLAFLLTTDIYRLEHLCLDDERQIDVQTGHALLNKLLPYDNRVFLLCWEVQHRLEFKPRVSDEKTLRELLVEMLATKSDQEKLLHEALLYNLLPGLPRGLESLYHALQRELKQANTGEAIVERKPREHLLLHMLATSRTELWLARRLFNPANETWVSLLAFDAEDMEVERWDLLVENAASRPSYKIIPPTKNNATEKKRKKATPDGKTLTEKEQKATPEGETFPVLDLALKEPQLPLPYGSDQRDPLRREHLLSYALKDARESDRGLWAELLLDMDLYRFARCRSQFLRTWQPTHTRLQRCCFRFSQPVDHLQSLILDNPDVKRAVFYWLEHEDVSKQSEKHSMSYGIGWPQLFAGLRRARDPLDPALFEQLNVNPYYIVGDLPGDETLDLLPNRVWSLILFVDGLQRCPWGAFSPISVWLPATYIGLAAAFVRSAYAYAIQAATKELMFSEPQRLFLDLLRQSDPAVLAKSKGSALTEESVWEHLHNLFGDDLEEQLRRAVQTLGTHHSPVNQQERELYYLYVAADQFFQSPIYQSVKELLDFHYQCFKELVQSEPLATP